MEEFMKAQMGEQTGGVKGQIGKKERPQKLGVIKQTNAKALTDYNADLLADLLGNVNMNAAPPKTGKKRAVGLKTRLNPARKAVGVQMARFGQEKQALVQRKSAVVSVKKVETAIRSLNFGGELKRTDLVMMKDFIEQQNKRIELKNKYLDLIDMAIHFLKTGSETKQEVDALESLIAGLEGISFLKKPSMQQGGASTIIEKIKAYKITRYTNNEAKINESIRGLENMKQKIKADTQQLVAKLDEILPMYIPLRDELLSRGELAEGDELLAFVPKRVSPKRSGNAAAMEMDGGAKRRRGRPSKK
jgi:hypothetical protein